MVMACFLYGVFPVQGGARGINQWQFVEKRPVTPAQTGVQQAMQKESKAFWIPAPDSRIPGQVCAGMTLLRPMRTFSTNW
jgi:hypothetical protein